MSGREVTRGRGSGPDPTTLSTEVLSFLRPLGTPTVLVRQNCSRTSDLRPLPRSTHGRLPVAPISRTRLLVPTEARAEGGCDGDREHFVDEEGQKR